MCPSDLWQETKRAHGWARSGNEITHVGVWLHIIPRQAEVGGGGGEQIQEKTRTPVSVPLGLHSLVSLFF